MTGSQFEMGLLRIKYKYRYSKLFLRSNWRKTYWREWQKTKHDRHGVELFRFQENQKENNQRLNDVMIWSLRTIPVS